MEQGLPPSQHFDLVKLSSGVYAAIARENGAAFSNSGIIDLGDRTLVFDTFLTPRAATDLRVAAEFLTNRPIAYVINSHWHHDHIRGNQIFAPETEIISSRSTLQLIRTAGAQELQEDAENALANQKKIEEQMAHQEDPHDLAELSYWAGYYRALVESVSKIKLRPPTWAFDGRIVFHGTQRNAELISFGPGHTQDDIVLYLPDDRIAFASDLFFVQYHPTLEQGDLQGWLNTLDRLQGLNLDKIVPGHGPVGTPADIVPLRKYLKDLQDQAAQIVKKGYDPRAVDQKKVPAAYRDWRADRNYRASLHSLVQRLTA